MSTERFFIFLYVGDRDVEDYLNLAIYIANPDEKWPAHVTVAGPYRHRADAPRKSARVKFVDEVAVCGVDRFASAVQNTVFLKVTSPNLKSVWDKPDYGYNPHLTLYDGDDKDFAEALYNQLIAISPFFSFPIKETLRVRSVKGQRSFELYARVKHNLLGASSADLIRSARTLDDDARVRLICDAIAGAKAKAVGRNKVEHHECAEHA